MVKSENDYSLATVAMGASRLLDINVLQKKLGHASKALM